MSEVTADVVRSILNYDPLTGEFTWKVDRPRRKAGDKAGCPHSRGYWQIMIGRRPYLCHRLAWLYVQGEWPSSEIDHCDGDKTNNAISNIRLCTRSQNLANRPTSIGLKGASFSNEKRKWRAQITVEGECRHIGYFENEEAAHRAYCVAAEKSFGAFARTS